MSFQRRASAFDLGRRMDARFMARAGAGGAPLTLPTANLIAAYDARVGVTDVSGACSAWADQSGNGFNVTQGTSGRRPTITTSDGYASLQFDGTDDGLSCSMSWASGPKTYYAVIKPGTVAGYDAIAQHTSPVIFIGMRSTVSNFIGFDTADRNSGIAYGSTRCRVASEIQSGSYTVWKNGTGSTPTTWSGSNLALGGTFSIGANAAISNPLACHLHALFIYDAVRNTAVEDYITQEWGV